MRAILTTIFCVAALAACGTSTPTNEADDAAGAMIEDGRAIAEAQCSGCHAIDAASDSPRADAPPLKTVLATYDAEALATDFREHIHVGHPDMPDFDFGPLGTDALLAYLQSIQD